MRQATTLAAGVLLGAAFVIVPLGRFVWVEYHKATKEMR